METKLLTEFYHLDDFRGLDGYKANGGYAMLAKALKMQPQQIIDEVKASGLRGRGGAGFPTGTKWGFLPKNNEPRYLLCNADEGEPGTFKDRLMMERAPHQLIEGMIISSFAIGSKKSYIYIRGEYDYPYQCLVEAVQEAYKAGYLGKNILGSGFDHDMDVYRGAGAYICGEETGMISSLEGLKGQPKLKPPFPAVQGYLRKPTIVNNVETLAAVIPILRDGAAAYRKYGTEKSPGTKLFSLSGNVMKAGNYEVPLAYPLMDLIMKEGGGLRPGRKLKAVIPGGSSAPVLTAQECNQATLDYECLAQMGSMLGSGAVIVIDDSQCMVDLLGVLMHFYHHESCGQCTPCREGTGWLNKITHSILEGRGRLQDIDLLMRLPELEQTSTVANNKFKSFSNSTSDFFFFCGAIEDNSFACYFQIKKSSSDRLFESPTATSLKLNAASDSDKWSEILPAQTSPDGRNISSFIIENYLETYCEKSSANGETICHVTIYKKDKAELF